jgi:hypothetical protein
MGIGGISMWQLLILLLIVVLVFGTEPGNEPEEKLEPDQISADAPVEKTSSEAEKSKETSS